MMQKSVDLWQLFLLVFTAFFCHFWFLILERFFKINKHLSKVLYLLTDGPILTPNPAQCFLPGVGSLFFRSDASSCWRCWAKQNKHTWDLKVLQVTGDPQGWSTDGVASSSLVQRHFNQILFIQTRTRDPSSGPALTFIWVFKENIKWSWTSLPCWRK